MINIKQDFKDKKFVQLAIRLIMFLLFVVAIFVAIPGLRYIFILFIIANIILGFMNGKKSIITNIVFILLAPSLFILIWEYLITVILVVLTGIHTLLFYLWFRRGGVEKVKVKKVEKKIVKK